MGQRSQIYVKYEENLIVANYYQWNYAERMISRARSIVEYCMDRLQYDWTFKEHTSIEKLRRFCDINFDMRDVVTSTNIFKEYEEAVQEGWTEPGTFNDYGIKHQDNNDGQLFIHITGGIIKYAFASYEGYDKVLTPSGYMEWDERKDWDTPTEYFDEEDIEICRNNIKFLEEHAVLMTVEELNDFVNGDYEQKPF